MPPAGPDPPFPGERLARARVRSSTLLTLGLLFAALVFVSHAGLITMPYFWDEAGQFVPAAWDLYREGALIPASATPNVHPPGVMAWAALFWKLFAPHPAVTRVAMLLLASATLLVVFLLAVELSGSAQGAPAFFAVIAFACAPLFYTQALLLQLDLPATLFTCLAFYLFLRERHWPAIAACCALVMVKETGALAPLLLGAWLLFEKRRRRASFYLLPLALLAAWLVYLRLETGYWLGNPEFARYNVASAARLSHVGLSLARRLYYLFIGHCHWIATLALVAGWRAGVFARRRWRIAGLLCAAHVLLVSILGGAVLERYLLPVLPFFYTAAVLGLFTLRPMWKWTGYAVLCASLIAGLFINPLFWPFPYENNLAMADFTRLHSRAAAWLEERAPDRVLATAWPLSAVLARPDLGYVSRPLHVVELAGFSAEEVQALPASIDVFILYSRDWDPQYNLLRLRAFRWLARNLLGYREPVTSAHVQERFGLQPVALWRQRGQWLEIHARPGAVTSEP